MPTTTVHSLAALLDSLAADLRSGRTITVKDFTVAVDDTESFYVIGATIDRPGAALELELHWVPSVGLPGDAQASYAGTTMGLLRSDIDRLVQVPEIADLIAALPDIWDFVTDSDNA